MIDFLSPLYLLAVAAAAVPLFLHLLRRRIGRRLDFPAVRYLARAEKEHSRRLRLRNLLLMLLRVAAVLLVATAAARPIARVVGSGHAPTALAVVLDNSLSTSAISAGRSVLDDLKARARAAVERAGSEDRLWLVTADGAVQGGSRSALLDAIERVEPLAGAGDLALAVTRGSAMARRAVTVEREVALLTDGQASAWRQTAAAGDVRVLLYRPRGGVPRNRAVVAARATPIRWTPRGAVSARVLTTDSATYRIALEGRTLARGTAAQDEEILVQAAPPERGWSAGALELAPDELRGDDTRHFAVWIGSPPSVSPHLSAGEFVESGIGALVQTERVTIGGGIAVASADQVKELPALLIAPADPLRIGAANRVLERLAIPWRFGAAKRGESAVRGSRLDGVSVSLRYSLARHQGPSSDTLATTSGEPWIVSGRGYVLVASPLLPQATSLPVRAAFVPWLGEMLTQHVAEEAGVVLFATPGALVPRPRGVTGLESPDARQIPLSGDTLTAPGRAGVFFLTNGKRRAGALVVNAEPEESILARLDAAALAARVRARDIAVVDDSARWETAAFSSAPRRPVAVPLLVVVLATLVIESVVAGSGRRKAA